MSEKRMSDKARRQEQRRCAIIAAARDRAESEGWTAVTTRHLADAIGYSQPVLYGHFPGGKSEIMLACALDGFVELGRMCREAIEGKGHREAVEAVAHSYLDFADANPAIYEVMFHEPIEARFAEEDNETELREGFSVLSEIIGDPVETEIFWGALHGIGTLEATGRMKAEHRAQRVAALAARFGAT